MTEIDLDLDDVERAARRLRDVAHRTPELTSRTLDEQVGAAVRLKAECFQRTGSFKFRGAFNAVASLPAAERAIGARLAPQLLEYEAQKAQQEMEKERKRRQNEIDRLKKEN